MSHRPQASFVQMTATLLIPTQIFFSVPVSAAQQQAPPAAPKAAAPPAPLAPPAPPKVKVNRTVPQVEPAPAFPLFPETPTVADMFRARVFGEPLVPVGGTPDPLENRDLAAAVMKFLKNEDAERAEPITSFLRDHPESPWSASLLTNLGIAYNHAGRFTKADEVLREAWTRSKDGTGENERGVAGRAIAELFSLHAQFGHVDELEALIAEVGDRPLPGAAQERLHQARTTVWGLREHHERAVPSGPLALQMLMEVKAPGRRRDPRLDGVHATPDGASIEEIRNLANEVGLGLEMAEREPGTPIVVPSLVHLKANHFSALTRFENGRYLLEDPLLGGELWVTAAALDEESSGYFLVPAKTAKSAGWKTVDRTAAGRIRGKCFWPVPPPGNTPKTCNSSGGGCPPGTSCTKPMADYTIDLLLANLRITDTPVGYTPPRGPEVRFGVTFNHRDGSQPSVFYFSNLGPRWTFDWLSYAEDDPSNAAAPVKVYLRGGGQETHNGVGAVGSAPDAHSHASLVRTSSSPIRYERRLPDGSIEVFARADGAATSPRRVFMTESRDPQGNAIAFTYDAQLRLVAVTDAIGQVTTLTYGLTGDPLKITKVTDPFGRFATFDYDASLRMVRITDAIGITSEFQYSLNGTVAALTTPYGTTTFAFGFAAGNNWVEATDPLGGLERVEYLDSNLTYPSTETSVPTGFASNNASLNLRNTYYWGKRASMLFPGDYTKAVVTHWLYENATTVGDFKHSEKNPLEGRVWYGHEGGATYNTVGPTGLPTKIARVLDDGSSQIYRYEYNALGNPTRETDPLGRTTVYNYAPNGVDLLEVRQVNGQTTDLLRTFTYNPQHDALTETDTAGQTTNTTYNSAGQVLTVTTPPRAGITENRTTTYSYDPNGYLQSVAGPAAGATAAYTYDGYGRVRTVTDVDSYVITMDYDVLDRPTRVTFPDGTYQEMAYNRLDLDRTRDRLGRWSQTFYDALRRPTASRDALGRTTTQEWCNCGSLDKLTEPSGNATRWDRDLQGRVTRAIRADGSAFELTYENTTSRLRQIKDAKNQLIGVDYFGDGTAKQVTFTNAQNPTPNITFTYESAYRRLATMNDGTGTTAYGYRPIVTPPSLGAGRLNSVDGPLPNDTIAYAYDELGRGVGRSINGTAVTRTYDALGRITGETNALGTFAFGYDGVTGRMATAGYPNGQTMTFTYFDNTGDRRLREIRNQRSGGAVFSVFGYSYDLASNITAWTQQTDANPANVFEFGYDRSNQLLSGVLKTQGATPSILKRYAYAYDPAGNRTAEQLDDLVMAGLHNTVNQLTAGQPGGALLFRGAVNEAASVNVAGQPATVAPDNKFEGTAQVASGTNAVTITATDPSGNVRTNTYQVNVSGATRNLTYDANGNLISDGTRTYEWDALNRLLAVNQGTHRSEFTYNGLSQRVRIVEKDNGAVTTDKRYVWRESGICEERDAAGSGVLKRFFTLGVQDGATSFFYTKDHLGSIREMTDSSGAIRARYDYDPYGRATKLSGDKDSLLGFTGHVTHSASGLALAQFRAYDPGTGRWLSPDPLGFDDGTNLYAYVHGNPIGYIDPDGNTALAIAAGGFAGFTAPAWVAPAAVVVTGAIAIKGAWDTGEIIAERLFPLPPLPPFPITNDPPGPNPNPAPPPGTTTTGPGGGTTTTTTTGGGGGTTATPPPAVPPWIKCTPECIEAFNKAWVECLKRNPNNGMNSAWVGTMMKCIASRVGAACLKRRPF